MYKLCFYVPETHLEIVKTALFQAGAGKIGHYDCCAWQVKGEGQYRPLENSDPFKGEKNSVCREVEFSVEMVCEDHLIDKLINILYEVHPYETPAFSTWAVRGHK